MSDIPKIVGFEGCSLLEYTTENTSSKGGKPVIVKEHVDLTVRPSFDDGDDGVFGSVEICMESVYRTRKPEQPEHVLSSWEQEGDPDKDVIYIHRDMVPALIKALEQAYAVGTCCD